MKVKVAEGSYKVVSTGVVHHPSLPDHSGASSLGVFNGLHYAHQWDISASGWAKERQKQKTV